MKIYILALLFVIYVVKVANIKVSVKVNLL